MPALVLALAATPAMAGEERHNWSGFYAGLGINGLGTGIDVHGVGAGDDADLEHGAVSLAGVAGYNFTSGPFVFGIDADISNLGFEDSADLTGLGTVKASADWNAAVALRAGWAIDDLMLYARAGLALSDVQISSSLGGSKDKRLAGGVLGVGAEYAMSNTWSLRSELNVYGFQSSADLAGSNRDFDLAQGVARIAIVAKF
jgi:outer membrane immunogenic protein